MDVPWHIKELEERISSLNKYKKPWVKIAHDLEFHQDKTKIFLSFR